MGLPPWEIQFLSSRACSHGERLLPLKSRCPAVLLLGRSLTSVTRFVVSLVLAEPAAGGDVEVSSPKAAGTIGVKVECRAIRG